METILLAWNPDKFPWGDLRDELAKVKQDGRATDRWSVGNRRNLESGARFFLIRLGSKPRGLVGSGWITSKPFEASRWDVLKSERGEKARYVDIFFDELKEAPLISMDELLSPPFGDVHWSTQMSGITIPAEVAEQLETLWKRKTATGTTLGREEFDSIEKITEGHAARVYVNRYERSSQARALCLAKYGLKCAACNILLRDFYGPVAEDLIHVHHLRQLSDIPGEYTIDPVQDLRPVCPNCHAVIHSRKSPYSIEEVASMIAKRRL